MEIIPAIDIRGGRCVRLYQGDFSQETVFDEDPARVARRFQEIGAGRLHVVDLDGAREGRPINTDTIKQVLSAVAIPVQVGGGLRRLADLEAYLAAGADTLVLGTAAIHDPSLIEEAVGQFLGRIIVSIDARDGRLAADGWLTLTDVKALDLARDLVDIGVARFVYTDISRDGTLQQPNFTAISELIDSLDAQIIASGGVSRLEDLVRLAELGASGAIVGRALYSGHLDLSQALQTIER